MFNPNQIYTENVCTGPLIRYVYTINELFDTFRDVYYTIFKVISLFDFVHRCSVRINYANI